MNLKQTTFFQLFLRVALSASFLSASADRLGIWGNPGEPSVAWGSWANFLAYSQSVNSYAGPGLNVVLAIGATSLEILLPVFLLMGFKLKYTAFASGLLLLSFGLAMTYSFGIKSSLDYSVWTGAAASFLLSSFNNYRYSIDNLNSQK